MKFWVVIYKANHIYVFHVDEYKHAKSDALTALTLNTFFWDVRPFSLVDN
jgi:tRNA A37 threonylcarbamoyladenosine biosynthesis protein TsaE